MKVFISQPMRGKSELYIQALRSMAIEALERKISNGMMPKEFRPEDPLESGWGLVEVLESYLPENENRNPLEALGHCIQLMARADLVLFLPGHENARGCHCERIIARKYQKQIAYYDMIRDNITFEPIADPWKNSK